MTDPLLPVLQRVPLFADQPNLSVSELTGGITNRNYKILANGQAYVLRVGGNDTNLLGIDRRVEYGCTRAAAEAGVAPEPVAFIEPEGYLVTRFIEGQGIAAEDIGTPHNIWRVVESLKRIHALSHVPGSFSPFRVVETYAETARRYHVQLPAAMNDYLEASRRIETALYRLPFVPHPCHNDLLNANFIDDGQRIRILDWEYAGMGDIYFDLGNFAVQHHFDDGQDEDLLSAYFGSPTNSRRARLKLMKIMSDLREAMWGMVQAGVSTLDFDYLGYGRNYFDRFNSAVRHSGFSQLLAQA